MQGYLKKKSPKMQGKKVVDVWQKRFFVLDKADEQLKYYKTEKNAASSSEEPLKSIALVQVHCAVANPKHANMFTIDLGAERKVKLQALSEEDRDAWVAAIQSSKAAASAKQEKEADRGAELAATSRTSSPTATGSPSASAQVQMGPQDRSRLRSNARLAPNSLTAGPCVPGELHALCKLGRAALGTRCLALQHTYGYTGLFRR